jgi:hypothetical protein
MWDPQHLTTLQASTTYYEDNLTFLLYNTMRAHTYTHTHTHKTYFREFREIYVPNKMCGLYFCFLFIDMDNGPGHSTLIVALFKGHISVSSATAKNDLCKTPHKN